MTTRYIPHIVYTLAITSLGAHLLYHRKEAEDQRAHYTARIALLEEVAGRLRAGKPVPERDFELIRKLAKEPGMDRATARGVEVNDNIEWREVLLGRKGDGSSEKWETQDWENGAFRTILRAITLGF